MVERGRRWEVVRSPSYLRFALPGLVLVVLSGVFWGPGWWPHLALFVGVGLVVLPLPTTPKDRVRAETRPGNRTGAR
ncbi:MAG TPA: hypothetical protein VFY88_11290 [Intrasporangium sp.]|nr:hypothetical protein [Intrasporangium sp.]